MRDKKIDEANEIKAKVNEMSHEIESLEEREAELEKLIRTDMMAIPNIIAPNKQPINFLFNPSSAQFTFFSMLIVIIK